MPTYNANVIVNPGAEVDVSGWTTSNCTLTRVTTPVHFGVGAFSLAAVAAGNMQMISTGITTGIVPGQTVQIGGSVRAAASPRASTVQVDWYGAAGYISTTGLTGVTSSTTAYTVMLGAVTVPAAANQCVLYPQCVGVAIGEVQYWDDLSFQTEAATIPTANAGPAQTVDVTAAAQLDGSGSTAGVTYTWSKVSGPAGTLSSTTAVNPTYTPTASGTHVLGLVVSNASGTSAQSTVTITALDGHPVVVRRNAVNVSARRYIRRGGVNV